MNTRSKAIMAACMVALCATAVLLSALGVPGMPAQVGRAAAQAEQTYYGYVPWNIWRNESRPGGVGGWWLNPETMLDHGDLAVVGAHDATSVSIYTLPGKSLVKSFTVDKMESVITPLPNGTFFKIVASKPISVLLVGGSRMAKPDASFSSFLPSIDGGYVGKEFTFLGVHSVTPARSIETYGVSLLPGLPYIVFALEDSTVRIWDENGAQIAEYNVKANKYKDFGISPYNAYRLESTGNVMVQAFVIEQPCYMPAVKGTFIGNIFYAAGSVPESGNVANPLRFFLFSSTEGGKANIYDLDFARKSMDLTVQAGENASLRVSNNQYMAVESDKPILLSWRSEYGAEGGISVVGIAAGQTAGLFISPGEAYIFTYTDTVVTVDDISLRLPPDGIQRLTRGWHTISTDQNIIVETVNIADNQGLNIFGQYLPSAQSIGLRYEGLSLKPIEEQTPWLYYAAGGAAVVAIVAIALILRRRKH